MVVTTQTAGAFNTALGGNEQRQTAQTWMQAYEISFSYPIGQRFTQISLITKQTTPFAVTDKKHKRSKSINQMQWPCQKSTTQQTHIIFWCSYTSGSTCSLKLLTFCDISGPDLFSGQFQSVLSGYWPQRCAEQRGAVRVGQLVYTGRQTARFITELKLI